MLKIIIQTVNQTITKSWRSIMEELSLGLSVSNSFYNQKKLAWRRFWHLNISSAVNDFNYIFQSWLNQLNKEYHLAVKAVLPPSAANLVRLESLSKFFLIFFLVIVSLFAPQALATNKNAIELKIPLKKLIKRKFKVVKFKPLAVKVIKPVGTSPIQEPAESGQTGSTPPAVNESTGAPVPTTPNQPTPQPPVQPKPKTIAGWLPSWDTPEALKTLSEFNGVFNEVSPFWYGVDISGQVVSSPGAENADIINLARSDGDRLIPTISNAFNGQKVSEILRDPNRYRWHIALLVEKAVNSNYDGIDLDYENLKPEDRDLYSQFVADLAQALHEKGKVLTVTVQPKTEEPGQIPSTRAHNYAALGQAADYIRIMAYDKHYSGGPPGPVAPISWVDQVIAFAVTQIPKEKLLLGIPSYGYDWPLVPGGKGKSVVHDQAAAISFSRGAPVNWDPASASPFINYNDGGVNRIVWFENAQSIQAKADIAKKYDLAGVVFWRLGREDKTAYLALPSKLNTPAP